MGGVGASMPTVIKEIPGMDSLVTSVANTTGIDPKQVSGVISSTLARTLSTAAAGANGDQILKSFGTALASSSIGAASAKGVTSLFKDSFTPEQLAGMARATQLVTNSATTAIMSGKNTDQIAGSVINSLVSGAGSIQQAADRASTTPTKPVIKAENDQQFTDSYNVKPETVVAQGQAIQNQAIASAQQSGALQTADNQKNLESIP